jgi:hypothetical protein
MLLDYLDYMPRLAPGGDSGWVWIKRSLLGFWVSNYEIFLIQLILLSQAF